MNKAIAIAHNTFREAIRQKILYGLVFFTILLIFSSQFLGQLSIGGAELKIVKDMGLASIYMMGVFVSLSMGISLVFKEIDRKTIYTILSKPVSRFEFILGKFLGLIFTVGVELFLMACMLFVMMRAYGPIDLNFWKAVILIYVELCVLISITLVFSSYSSSFMTTMFCFSILVLGHLTDNFLGVITDKVKLLQKKNLMTPVQDFFYGLLENVVKLFNLDYFAINSKIVHGVPVSWSYIWNGVAYGFCLVILFLFIANYLFAKKDLK